MTEPSGIPATERSELAGRHYRASQARADLGAALRNAAAVTGHPDSLPRLALALPRALAARTAADAIGRAVRAIRRAERRSGPVAAGAVLAVVSGAVILARATGRKGSDGRGNARSSRRR